MFGWEPSKRGRSGVSNRLNSAKISVVPCFNQKQRAPLESQNKPGLLRVPRLGSCLSACLSSNSQNPTRINCAKSSLSPTHSEDSQKTAIEEISKVRKIARLQMYLDQLGKVRFRSQSIRFCAKCLYGLCGSVSRHGERLCHFMLCLTAPVLPPIAKPKRQGLNPHVAAGSSKRGTRCP